METNNCNKIFEEYLEPHLESIYRLAFFFCHNQDEAEDLMQETYLKALKNIDTFREGSSAKAWLAQILRNTYFTQFKKKKRIKIDELDEKGTGKEAESTDENAPLTNNEYEVFEMLTDPYSNPFSDETTKAILSIPPEQRIVLMLQLEDFSYKEIAEILEIDIEIVRRRLFNARKSLYKKLHK